MSSSIGISRKNALLQSSMQMEHCASGFSPNKDSQLVQ